MSMGTLALWEFDLGCSGPARYTTRLRWLLPVHRPHPPSCLGPQVFWPLLSE